MYPGAALSLPRRGLLHHLRAAAGCRNFVCDWLQAGSPFPEEFRPDRLGVMAIPVRWRGQIAYILRRPGGIPTNPCSSGRAP